MYNYANPYMARMAMSQNQTALAMHALQAQHAQAQAQAQQQAQQQSQQQNQGQPQPQQPPRTPQMQGVTPEQAQAQAHAIQMMSGYHMLNYAQMGLPVQGRMPPYQWQAMGFRRPVNGVGVNGMNANPPGNGQAGQLQAAQQMQRAMQGSVQGR
jgi:hypothetical protein